MLDCKSKTLGLIIDCVYQVLQAYMIIVYD